MFSMLYYYILYILCTYITYTVYFCFAIRQGNLFSPLLGPENSEYQSVVAFLNTIPQDVLAKASFRSRAYTRAVMHFESFIREKKQSIQDHLTFLQVSAAFTSLIRYTLGIKMYLVICVEIRMLSALLYLLCDSSRVCMQPCMSQMV